MDAVILEGTTRSTARGSCLWIRSASFRIEVKEVVAMFDAPLVERIVAAIEALARAPRPRGCRKLRGQRNLWRIRIGEYRVIYAVYDERQLVDIISVRHRSKAYE
jgi:mRNA interferase RelE/StbE